MNFVKYVKKLIIRTAPFPIVCNLLVLLGVSLYQGKVGSDIVLLSFISAVLQAAIPLSKKPAEKSVRLEIMENKKVYLFPKWLKKVPYYLILTPALSAVDVVLGFLFVLLSFILSLKYFYSLILRVANKEKLEEAALEKINEKDCALIVYVSGMKKVAYQINQWIPVLERLDENVLIMIRERSIYHGMMDTSLPVVFARTALNVEKCFDSCSDLKAILYPANPMKNAQALRHYKLQHCFINHGESDKAVNQSKFLMAYDKLFVGGQLAENRLKEAGLPLRSNQVVHVGRPQAEVLLDVKSENQKIKRILYAPTWEGFVENVNYSSVNELGWSLLNELASHNEYEVFFKPHPYTGSKNEKTASFLKKMKELCSESNINFIDPLSSIHDCMNNSDLLITDISSVMNEYLVTKKPIIMCNTSSQSDEKLHSLFPTCAAAYSITKEDSIIHILNQIKNDDRLDTVREKVKKHSLGDFPEGALNRFKAEINSLILK